MKSILPIILVILLLTGAITYSLSKRAMPKAEENRFGIAANKLEAGSTDNPNTGAKGNTGFNFVNPTPTVKPTPKVADKLATLPTTTENVTTTTKGDQPVPVKTAKVVITTTKTVICTPVYGQASTCTEHIVVDTGAADSIFFNFAGLAYIAGLASFIKAKTLKK